jgi:propanol-preferring alcohol dehydrogenase
MKAMQAFAPADILTAPLRLVELPRPRPAAGELLIRVRCCGICRTDLHVLEGDLPPVRGPVTPGHQTVGVVEELGEGCRRFRPGDRVGGAWLRGTCGHCRYCLGGRENLCLKPTFSGYHEAGGFAELVVLPEAFAYALPATFSDVEAAPLLCAGIIGYRALRRAEVARGGRLGLYGFGSSAHVVLQIARSWSCEVFVVTRGERHRRLARELGADWVGDAGETPPVKLDSAIVFAPAGEIVPTALEQLDRGGTLALAGIHMSDVPSLDYERHLFYERNLRSVTANTREDGRELLELAASIPLRPKTVSFPLEAANEALQALKADAIEGSGVLVMGAW